MGVLKTAPELIVIARQLADSVMAGRRGSAVSERVSALEQNELQQAELVKEMAEQLKDMSAVMQVLSGRLAICMTCSVVALVLSLATLFNALAR